MRKQLPWFKVYPEDWLADGVTLFLTPAQRGVFISLQAVAHTCPDRGTIQAAPDQPYEPATLARRCRCKLNLLTATLNRLEQVGKITRDHEGIHIANWLEDQEGIQPPLPGIGDHTKAPKRPQTKKQLAPATPFVSSNTPEYWNALSPEQKDQTAELDAQASPEEMAQLIPERQQAAAQWKLTHQKQE